MFFTSTLVLEIDYQELSVLDPHMNPSSLVLMDVKLDDEIFRGLTFGDYGHESDSNLEDEDGDEDEKEGSGGGDNDSVDANNVG